MKFLVALVIVACAIGFSECGLTPEQLELMKSTVKECASKEGATDADVQELMDHKPPSGRGGKCTMACVAETAGMVKGNKLDVDGSSALVAKVDPSKVDQAKEIGAACTDVTDGDRCEATFKIFTCLHDTAVSKGIKMVH